MAGIEEGIRRSLQIEESIAHHREKGLQEKEKQKTLTKSD